VVVVVLNRRRMFRREEDPIDVVPPAAATVDGTSAAGVLENMPAERSAATASAETLAQA